MLSARDKHWLKNALLGLENRKMTKLKIDMKPLFANIATTNLS